MKMDFKNKCYQTKEDKRHNSLTFSFDVPKERWESIFGTEEERQEKVKNFKQEQKERIIKGPTSYVSWDPEWTVLSTGKRMSKRELKQYCKEKGKEWVN